MGDSDSGFGTGTGSKFYQFGAGIRIGVNFFPILESESESESEYIDSLDRLTFRNQLISILLVVPTGQHLHAIFSFLAFC